MVFAWALAGLAPATTPHASRDKPPGTRPTAGMISDAVLCSLTSKAL